MALVTLQMIFQDVFPAYAQTHPLPAHVRRAARAVMQCRVVYTTAADNSLNPKTHYNVPLTPSSAGAWPWYQPSLSTNSVSWRWGASS